MFRGMKQVNSNNFSIMIKEILSLRYHPSLETSGMKFSASDFQPKDNPDHLSHIEKDIDRINKIMWFVGSMVFVQLIYALRSLIL